MRTKKSLYNFITSYIPYLILVILGFIKIKFFVGGLGEDLYSLNQLYNNFFAYISLAEGGLGAILLYKLYEPLSTSSHSKINALYSGTKGLFKKIGIITIAFGFLFSFVVPMFINNPIFSNYYIALTFSLFVVKSAVDYFMSVPRYILQADQKMYKINFNIYAYRIIEVLVEITLIMKGFDYLVILVPGIFIRIIQNYYINKKIFKIYPWLKDVDEKDESAKLEVKHLLVHRIVGLISSNVDIVILSTFTNSHLVAIYATYNYLIKYANDTTSQIFSSMKDGLGNVIHAESKEKIREIIDEFIILFSYLGSLIVIVFYFVLNDFIKLWLGSNFLTTDLGLLLFLIVLYYNITIRSLSTVRNTMGLFKETKIMAAAEAIINLTLSLILVNYMGLEGVLLSTTISFLLTNFWYYPYIIYKEAFNQNCLPYFKKLSINFLILLLVGYFSKYIHEFVLTFGVKNNLLGWFINTSIFGVSILIILTFINSMIFPEFRRIIKKVKKTVLKLK